MKSRHNLSILSDNNFIINKYLRRGLNEKMAIGNYGYCLFGSI